MSQRSIISNFNIHGEVLDEDEGGDDVVELIRPPSRQNLLFNQTGLRGQVRTLQLHVTENNPYIPRNMVYEGPLLRCSTRRACPSCSTPPCSPEETQCRACLNGEGALCLHRTPCRHWNPSQMTTFYRRQQSYMPEVSQEPSRSSNYIPVRSSVAQGNGAGGGAAEEVQGIEGWIARPHSSPHHQLSSPHIAEGEATGALTQNVQGAAGLTSKPPPPPHHHLISPLTHQTSTPEEGRVRGYCQQVEESPLAPPLSNLHPPQLDAGGVGIAQSTEMESENVIPKDTLASFGRLPFKGPPAYSKGVPPPRPPPPVSLQSVRPKQPKAVTFDSPVMSQNSPLPSYHSLDISQGSQNMSLCQSIGTPTLVVSTASHPILHTDNVIPRERPAYDRHPLRSNSTLSGSSGSLAASLGLITHSGTMAGRPQNLQSSVFHSPPLDQSHRQTISQHGGGEREVMQNQLLEGGGATQTSFQPLSHSLGHTGPRSSHLQPTMYTTPLPLHPRAGDDMYPDSLHQTQARRVAGAEVSQVPPPRLSTGGFQQTQQVSPLPSLQQQQRPDFSVPISLLIDRIQDLQIQRRSSSSEARIKPTQLPAPKYTSSGQITGLEYYRWIHIFTQTIDRLHLNHAACHAELVTNRYILPQELRTLVSESVDLKTALARIQARFPPLSSIWPELYRELSSIPTCNNNRERIERAGSLISTLTLMDTWFSPRDIQREDLLYVIHRIEGAQEGNLTLLRDIQQIEHLHSLHVTSPHHRSYISSLIQRLEHLRSLWAELEASLAIASRKPVTPSVSSFSFSSQPIKKKNSRGAGGQEKHHFAGSGEKGPTRKRQSGNPAASPLSSGRKGTPPPGCFICRATSGKGETVSHKPWFCPCLSRIRAKQMTPPKELCQKCCSELKEGVDHRSDCYMIPSKSPKDGSTTRFDLSCPLHSGEGRGYIHQKLCTACGPNLPPPKPRPGIQSFAFRVKSRGSEIQRCAFMTEIIPIVGTEGQHLRCKIQYDSLGGGNFSSCLPEGFHHGAEGALTEPFTLNTITGTSDYCLPLALLMLDTPQKGKVWIEFMVTDFPDGGYLELDEQTRKKCAIHPYTEEEIDKCEVRLILGVANALHFPEAIASPPSLSSRYPGLTLWKSRLSGQILFQGGLPTPSQKVSSFLSLAGNFQGEEDEELYPSVPPSTPGKDDGHTSVSQ